MKRLVVVFSIIIVISVVLDLLIVDGTPHSRTIDTRHERTDELGPRTGQAPASVGVTTDELERPSSLLYDYGDPQPVKANSSPQAQSIRDAIVSERNPERLSTLFLPEAFDIVEYSKNPDAYLRKSEPGRVFDCAQPGPKVPELRPNSKTFVRLSKRGETTLSVTAAPLAPVTLTSFDLGSFKGSGLPSITVKADETGVAEATFVASDGAINDVHILAGSPMASGQVRFTVVIENPDLAASAK